MPLTSSTSWGVRSSMLFWFGVPFLWLVALMWQWHTINGLREMRSFCCGAQQACERALGQCIDRVYEVNCEVNNDGVEG